MQTVEIGSLAEQAAAEHLERLGYTVIGRNWRHRRCEIDIIATKGQSAYFVEVKYRHRDYAGNGLEYVTTRKVRQMAFAADMWLAYHRWHGPYQLCAIAVTGDDYVVTDFVEAIE